MTLVEKYLEYVRPMKGSQKYHRWALLTVVSAILERRVWVDRGRLGVIFPNMYTLLVGLPSTGKSMAAGLASDMIKEVLIEARPRIRVGPTKITQAALYKELKDAERMYAIPGVGDCRSSPLFIYASELSINLSDFGGGTLTNELIDFYDSKGLKAEMQKRLAADTAADVLTLLNPSITLLGCTTDEFLQSAAQDKLVTSGLSSRIMFVVEPNRVEKERNHIEVDLNAYRAIIDDLIGVYRLSGAFKMTKEAHKRYVAIAEAADEDCQKSVGPFYQNYFGRKPDHVTKVAMVMAAMRHSMEILPEDMDIALEWIVSVEPDMIKAFGIRKVDDDPGLVGILEKHIPYFPMEVSEQDLRLTMADSGKFLSGSTMVEDTFTGLLSMGNVKRENRGGTFFYTKHADKKKITRIIG